MAPGFDVFVIGPPQPAGEPATLAAALAGKLGISATAAAQGLAERKLCAGRGLEPGAAQALTRDLRALGATTMMRPSSAPPSPVPSKGASSAAAGALPAALRDSNSLSLTEGIPLEPEPAARPPAMSANPFAPPPSGAFGHPPQSQSAPVGPSSGSFGRPASGNRPDPFAPPSSPNLGMGLDTRFGRGGPPHPSPTPPPIRATPDSGESSNLELAGAGPAQSSAEFRRSPSTSVGGAAALNVTRLGPAGATSGLAVDSDAAAGAYRVRCPKHGLSFDTRKASGCSKCLEPGRKMSAQMEEQARVVKLFDGQFEDNPLKRAFVGLALALVIGFMPAAYHALRIGSHELRRLRDEQEMLSRKPATEEIARQFQEVDAAVATSKSRSMRNTGVIWLLVSGGTLFGWFRLT